MNIVGHFYSTIGGNELRGDGAFSYHRDSNVSGINWGSGGSSWGTMTFNASRSWAGSTSSNGSHTHEIVTTTTLTKSSIYGNNETVQPAALKFRVKTRYK